MYIPYYSNFWNIKDWTMKFKSLTLLLLACTSLAQANLIQNSSFEDPFELPWKVASFQGPHHWSIVNDGHTGGKSFFTNAPRSFEDTLMQDDFVLEIGTTYEVSFWIKNFGVGDDFLNATIIDENGNASLQQSPISTELESWERLSFFYTAEGTNGHLWINLGDSNGVQIDDVSVEAVPEPATFLTLTAGIALLRRNKKSGGSK